MLLGRIVPVLALAAVCLAEAPKSITVRGKLVQSAGQPPALETADGKRIALTGDAPTVGVLKDARLAGFEMEARGHFSAPGQFAVDPIHTKAMFAFKDGKAKLITYWCDLCSIRTYTPGVCWCCQQETTLDLRDPDQP